MIIANNVPKKRVFPNVICEKNETVIRDTNRQHYFIHNTLDNSVDVYKLEPKTGKKEKLFTLTENTLFQTVAKIEQTENIVIEHMY